MLGCPLLLGALLQFLPNRIQHNRIIGVIQGAEQEAENGIEECHSTGGSDRHIIGVGKLCRAKGKQEDKYEIYNDNGDRIFYKVIGFGMLSAEALVFPSNGGGDIQKIVAHLLWRPI
jgi:hypothetical protein